MFVSTIDIGGHIMIKEVKEYRMWEAGALQKLLA
jgi:hypothetical protein